MGNPKGPSEGGSGGKRGHSNMEHWGYTDEVKEAARSQRRLDDVRESAAGLTEHPEYRVRVYCDESWRSGSCAHDPSHPLVLSQPFRSIRSANDHGDQVVAELQDETIEWEVLDASGNRVC